MKQMKYSMLKTIHTCTYSAFFEKIREMKAKGSITFLQFLIFRSDNFAMILLVKMCFEEPTKYCNIADFKTECSSSAS